MPHYWTYQTIISRIMSQTFVKHRRQAINSQSIRPNRIKRFKSNQINYSIMRKISTIVLAILKGNIEITRVLSSMHKSHQQEPITDNLDQRNVNVDYFLRMKIWFLTGTNFYLNVISTLSVQRGKDGPRCGAVGLSIPKSQNPAIDETGKYCSINQDNENVWFLTGTFGNIVPVNRKCTVPVGRGIFFPILVKEDSFQEDPDLKSEDDLKKRCRNATNRLVQMEAIIDGKKVDRLENYRVQSEVFDLTFPEDNVYNARPGLTRSVCDGYWLFVKPLSDRSS